MLRLIAHQGTPDESIAVVLLVAAIWIGWIGWTRLRSKGFERLPRPGAWALVAVAAALVVAAPVVPRALVKPSTIASGPRPSSTATLSFVRPSDGETVTGNTLTVVLRLTGGTIVDQASTSLAPNTGHVHLILDGQLVSMTYGTTQVLDLSRVGPGSHSLEGEFVAADHGPFSPPVQALISFTKAG